MGIGVFILIACTYSTLHETNTQPEPVPEPVKNLLKVTPGPLLTISSIAPDMKDPQIISLKDDINVVKEEKKVKKDNTVSNDQKRLEPPIPQEPEVKKLEEQQKEQKIILEEQKEVLQELHKEINEEQRKLEQNADLDPQALQKEDKEIQKNLNLPSSNVIDSAKKDKDLDKQEKLLQKLEEQHKEQKLILEEQKKVLQELKLHKESHEEQHRVDLADKPDVRPESKVPFPSEKPPDIPLKTTSNSKVKQNIESKNIESVPLELKKENILPERRKEKIKLQLPAKNSSVSVPKQQVIAENVIGEVQEVIEAKPLSQNANVPLPKEVKKATPVKDVEKVKQNLTVVSVQSRLREINKNTSLLLQPNVSNLPLSPDTEAPKSVPDNLKSQDSFIKKRETLQKKDDYSDIPVAFSEKTLDIQNNVNNNRHISNVNIKTSDR
ncbi:zinc finger protein 853-like isoform X1 [Stegodyphus dumicola]|uniref:zinc finger protein 853-like isoform X1 n=1 Tax=Stegodyphus dumicola TaxID=202533 RepID=UPI0015B08D28|nr:zinc finger protein 853-like isoform X1 [Stegodyphus dumicola]